MKGLAYNRSAIMEEDIDVFASHDKAPGATRVGLEYFRTFPVVQSRIENRPTLR